MLPLLALLSPALAVDAPMGSVAPAVQKTLGDYAGDLKGDDAPDRLYAARVLRGEVRRAVTTEARASPDSLAYAEARSTLVELYARVPDACGVALAHANAVAPCADMLGWLAVPEAEGPLREALARETRPSVRARIEAALQAIAAAQ